MKLLSNKTFLAMRATLFIAYNGNETLPVSASAIVDYYDLNRRALEPVLQKLSNGGLIVSVKGARGGYHMPNPESTTLRDVVELFLPENKFKKDQSVYAYDDILNSDLSMCYEGLLGAMSDVNFVQLCLRAKQSGITPMEEPALNFTI